MEQFRQVGEVLGSLKALMVLKDDIQINQRQCCLLLDIFTLAFSTVAEEIRLFLKSEEKNTKWKALEQPLRELHKVFKEGEHYVKQCIDFKDWWGKAISLHQNKDCVEFHIHNLLCYFPAVIEAIETAGEISGLDPDEMQRRRVAFERKYDREWNDPKLFQFRFGKEYLITREVCNQFESAYKEDKWLLIEALKEKKRLGSVVLTKNEQQLVDLLLKKLNGTDPSNVKLFPSSILLGGKDYQVKRRLGGSSQFKEIQWLGDSFVLRHFYGELESLSSEISTMLSLSHPNIVQYLCGFCDEDKKEFFLVMELMSKDLACYTRETFGSRRRNSFSLPVVVDLMLQIARGMEFLHARKIYHGELNPSNIYLKARSIEGYFYVKVSGFGLSTARTYAARNSPASPLNQNVPNPFIWYAPEVLAEQEGQGSTSSSNSNCSEKADVYSFGMLCFELLTGKVPFEDGHLQGDKVTNNIRAGERPLFPSGSPKYLVNLTKKCWQTNPSQRPSFSSICRILRYIKKFMANNPDTAQSESQSPLADYCNIEAGFVRKFVGDCSPDIAMVSQIPFQMFAYKIAEKEQANSSNKGKHWVLGSDVGDDGMMPVTETRSVCSDVKSVAFDMRSVYSEAIGKKVSNFDMRSVRSESPIKKMKSNVSRLIQAMVLEKNTSCSESKSEVLPDTIPEEVPENNISTAVTKSACSDNPQDKIIPNGGDTTSACSKISDKKVGAIKKSSGVKIKKGPARSARSTRTTSTSQSPRTQSTSQSPRPSPKSPKSPPFIPSGHCLKKNQDFRSPSRRRSSVNVSNSEVAL